MPPIATEDRIDLIAELPRAVPETDPERLGLEFPVLRDDVRQALTMRPPMRLRFANLPLHPGSVLTSGYGVVTPGSAKAGRLGFRVEIETTRGKEVVFDAGLEVQADGANRWFDAEVPLSRPSTEEERFDLILQAKGGAPDSVAGWAWPRIHSQGVQMGRSRGTIEGAILRRDLLESLTEAEWIAGRSGQIPEEFDVNLPGERGHQAAVILPLQGGLRHRVELGPRDLLRSSFFVAKAKEGARGPITFEVRLRAATAGEKEPKTDWKLVGAETIDLDSVRPGILWLRHLRRELPLDAPQPGLYDLEVALVADGPKSHVYAGFTALEIATRREIPRRSREGSGSNVIVVLVDTLRMDHVSAYGYPRKTTPFLDEMAERGIVFEQAVSTSSWTLPAIASLFTGRYPSEHRVVTEEHPTLPPRWQTLAETLREAGYTTAAFMANPFLTADNGFDQGFEDFHELVFMNADRVNREVLRWLRKHQAERFFAYIHYLDPHTPYSAPDPFYRVFDPHYAGVWDHNTWPLDAHPMTKPLCEAFARGSPIELDERLAEEARIERGRIYVGHGLMRRMIDLYDAEIRYWDFCFGKLMQSLAALNLDRETLVLVVGDHGEAFGDHGHFGHGFDLYDSVLRVPMILLGPGLAPRRIRSQASLVDVLPIVLERAGLPVPPDLPGTTLSQLQAREGSDRFVLAQTSFYLPGGLEGEAETTVAHCVRSPRWKLIHAPRYKLWEAYRLDDDPSEARPLTIGELREVGVPRELGDRLASLLLEHHERLESGADGTERRHKRDRRVLEALGYLR